MSKTRKPDAQRYYCLLFILFFNLFLTLLYLSFAHFLPLFILLHVANPHNLCCSSHVTPTVWRSDRHISLLPRCDPGHRQPPRRLQGSTLRQHGCPPDALPTGRTTSFIHFLIRVYKAWHKQTNTQTHKHPIRGK